MEKAISFIGKCIMLLGIATVCGECTTPKAKIISTIIGFAAILIGLAMAKKDLDKADGRA